jgi:hypothetical protein
LVLLVVVSEGSRPNFSRYDSSDGSSIVTEPIPAGGEIFKHYGDEWFYSRPGYSNLTWGFYDIPKALCLLDEFSRRIPNVVQNDLYNTAVIAIRDIWKESRILQALPDDALGNGVFPPLGTSVVVALVVAFSSAAPGCCIRCRYSLRHLVPCVWLPFLLLLPALVCRIPHTSIIASSPSMTNGYLRR